MFFKSIEIYNPYILIIGIILLIVIALYICCKDAVKSYKTFYITYGGPDSNYHDAVNRITKEVDDIQVFDHILGYTDLDLKADHEFWGQHSDFCENSNWFGGGFGCWIWKPYLIMKTMQQMDYGDVIVYTDAGCTIKSEKSDDKKRDMLKLLDLCREREILFTSTFQPEKYYSKMDLIKHFGMENRPDILNSTQYQGGVLFIKKTYHTMRFVTEWYDTMCIYHLGDGNSSKYTKDLPEYKGSRNDQSVFSLLAKKYGYTEANMMEQHDPILISRRRGG